MSAQSSITVSARFSGCRSALIIAGTKGCRLRQGIALGAKQKNGDLILADVLLEGDALVHRQQDIKLQLGTRKQVAIFQP